MTEKTRHAASCMMFGQAIRGQHEWKSRIARRRQPIFVARKPVHRRIRVMRIKFVRDGGLERFVMRRQRPILQTFWHVKPTQSVLMQNKRRITGNRIQSLCVLVRSVLRRFSLYETGTLCRSIFPMSHTHFFVQSRDCVGAHWHDCK